MQAEPLRFCVRRETLFPFAKTFSGTPFRTDETQSRHSPLAPHRVRHHQHTGPIPDRVHLAASLHSETPRPAVRSPRNAGLSEIRDKLTREYPALLAHHSLYVVTHPFHLVLHALFLLLHRVALAFHACFHLILFALHICFHLVFLALHIFLHLTHLALHFFFHLTHLIGK